MRPRDEGAAHTLEAALVACIMVGAVGYVVSFQPTHQTTAEEVVANALGTRVKDFVETRFDWPIDAPGEPSPCVAETKGDQWILDAASNRRSSFRDDANQSLGEHVDANLILKNGHGRMSLYHDFDNPAIAGNSHTYMPNWSGAYAFPTLNVATGAEQIEINTAAIIEGELAMQKGDAVEIAVTFDNGNVKRIYAPIALLGKNWNQTEYAQDLFFVEPTSGARSMAITVEARQVAPPPFQVATPLAFSLSPGLLGSTALIPAGTTLTLKFPPQWSDIDSSRVAPHWQYTQSGTTALGLEAQFVLMQSVTESETIRLDAFAPTAPSHPFDVITADVSQGALTHAEFIVAYPTGVDKGLPVTLHSSVPYPVRAGSSAILGVGVANGGSETTIRQVDFLLPGGFDMRHNQGQGAQLFASATPTAVDGTGEGGTWSRIDARHVQWKGARGVGASAATDFLVRVEITEDLDQATAIESDWTPRVLADLEYENEYTTTSTSWGATPGFLRTLVQPDSPTTTEEDGYPFDLEEGGQALSHTIHARLQTERMALSTSTHYMALPSTSELGNVQSAAANASVYVSERVVPLGSLVAVEYDISNLLTTLADEGVGGVTLRTDLYTPPTQGCAPTASWSRLADTLPLAQAPSLVLYDDVGLGAPSLFAASDDQSAYKLGAKGTTTWSRELGAALTVVSATTMPHVGASVFAGASDGSVARLDPVISGEIAWARTHATSADATSLPAIRGIATHPQTERLLVWSDQVVEILDAASGASIAVRDLGTVTNKVQQAAWDEDGYVLVLTTHALQRLDNDLQLLGAEYVEDAVGFSITGPRILVAVGSTITTHDSTTLNPNGDALPLGGQVKLATSGDATRDGAADLVVALDTLDVLIVDGTTGLIARTHDPTLPELAEWGLAQPTLPAIWAHPEGSSFKTPVSPKMECPDDRMFAHDVGSCVLVENPNNDVRIPLLLHAADGRMMYSFVVGSLAKTLAWEQDDRLALEVRHDFGEVPTSITSGAWTAGAPAYAIATSDGEITLRDEHGVLLWRATPTAQSGRFTFLMRVPLGGFLGTNVLANRIQWIDPVNGPQEAAIPAWFQVVAPDGTPVQNPWYTLDTITQSPDVIMVTRTRGP